MIVGIVDDDKNKRRSIAQVLEQYSDEELVVHEAASRSSARRLLRETELDLLVLDIAIPEFDDGEPVINGGISFLREMISSTRFYSPKQVVGLTALEEIYETAATAFGGELWSVVKYDQTSSEWVDQLGAKVRHLLRAKAVPAAPPPEFDLGIVVALKEPELSAVLDLQWDWQVADRPGDPTQYYIGTFRRSDGTSGRVVAARAPQMGMPAATVTASKLGLSFRPRCIAMTGICAGVRGETSLGDVVAANPVWDYGSGKHLTKDGSEVFEPAPYPLTLSTRIRRILEEFEGESAPLSAMRAEYGGTSAGSVPRLHIGPFASGAAVVARSAVLQEVQLQHRKLIALDMEAYGVATAASELSLPPPEFLVLKGVSDFADERKDDAFRGYASYMSAQLLSFLCTERNLC
jgi:nucleoside phosphorylase